MPGLYTEACNAMLDLAQSTKSPLRSIIETTTCCLRRPRFLSGAHRFWGKQIDAAVMLGEWELASRGLEGLVKDMKDRAEAGFAVGEISLAMQVLRAAIRRALNGAIKGCGADDRVELKNLH